MVGRSHTPAKSVPRRCVFVPPHWSAHRRHLLRPPTPTLRSLACPHSVPICARQTACLRQHARRHYAFYDSLDGCKKSERWYLRQGQDWGDLLSRAYNEEHVTFSVSYNALFEQTAARPAGDG